VKVKHLLASMCLISTVALTATKAEAAGDYFAGTSISGVPVLWVYAPPTNQIKLCFPTTSNTLSCTATVAALVPAPSATDVLQYRVTNNGSSDGALWIVDETTAKGALCGGTLTNGIFSISCIQGTGIK